MRFPFPNDSPGTGTLRALVRRVLITSLLALPVVSPAQPTAQGQGHERDPQQDQAHFPEQAPKQIHEPIQAQVHEYTSDHARERSADTARETPVADTEFEQLLVELSINGQLAGPGVLVLRQPSGEWLLPTDALVLTKLRIDDLQTQTINEIAYVALQSLGAQRVTFDESRAALEIHFDPVRFQPNVLDSRPISTGRLPSLSAGSFLNYDLLINHVANNTSYSLYTEAGTALGPGVAVMNALFIDREQDRQALRLDTTYTYDMPDRMATLRIGDAITHPSTILGRAVRFGGLQWGTNFRTRPGLITVPVATLSGQAALPSTVDLYVNDVLQTRSTVTPGPFSIISPPLVSGDGEVMLKVTDIAGQQQIVSQRFYASSALLSPGLTDYSVELGALRRHFGQRSNDYGDLFVAGSWRHGVSDGFTIEAGASAQQDGVTGAEAGAMATFSELGTGLAAIGISQAAEGGGAQLAAGFERRTKTHSFSLRTQLASKRFRQTGVDASHTVRQLVSLFYGYRMAGIGNISVSYTRQQLADAQPVTISTASLTPRQTPWGSFTVSLMQSRSERTDTSINLFWTFNLDRGASISGFHTRPSDAPSQSVLQVQSNLPPGEGWGYRLQVAQNAANQASVFGQNGFGAGRIEVAELNGEASARVGVSGGLAMLEGHMFVTRRIDGSFGVARLPGFDNVRIYVDNQLAARTNADGYALLPRLHPYLKNNVSIEQLDLPLDASMEQLRVYPVPGWRSGIVIDFPVKNAAAATMDLILDDGKPVPAGAVVRLITDGAEGSASFAVGDDGLLHLSGLLADNILRAQWPKGQCESRVLYSPEKGSVPYLGKQICERKGGRP